MPSMRSTQSENPFSGAGILRYFGDEKGIKIEPMVFIGITVTFIVFEIILNILY